MVRWVEQNYFERMHVIAAVAVVANGVVFIVDEKWVWKTARKKTEGIVMRHRTERSLFFSWIVFLAAAASAKPSGVSSIVCCFQWEMYE